MIQRKSPLEASDAPRRAMHRRCPDRCQHQHPVTLAVLRCIIHAPLVDERDNAVDWDCVLQACTRCVTTPATGDSSVLEPDRANSLTDSHNDSPTPQIGKARHDRCCCRASSRLLGSSRRPRQRKKPTFSRWALPLLGSNQDSPDPESSAGATFPDNLFGNRPLSKHRRPLPCRGLPADARRNYGRLGARYFRRKLRRSASKVGRRPTCGDHLRLGACRRGAGRVQPVRRGHRECGATRGPGLPFVHHAGETLHLAGRGTLLPLTPANDRHPALRVLREQVAALGG